MKKNHGRIIISLAGTSVTDEERVLIQHKNTAGILLFSRNYESLSQIKLLIKSIKQNHRNIPVFVDQEGGTVQRFCDNDFAKLPSLKEIGTKCVNNKLSDEALNLVKQQAFNMATKISQIGAISLAPVVDLDQGNSVISGKQRSFHHDPNIVSAIASAYIDGMNAAGMQATLKHFPGHGQKYNSGKDDSHFYQPHDHRDLAEIIKTDLIPFMKLAKKSAAIMPSHIIYDKIDANNPAGFSEKWMNDILVKQIGFEGIIVSDCLSMAGSGSETLLRKTEAILKHVDVAIVANQDTNSCYKLLESLGNKTMTVAQQLKFENWISLNALEDAECY